MTITKPHLEHLGSDIGPGRLVLVTGPSGAGKDTLIALARAACAGDSGIVFPRRVVTRDASSFEDNGTITPAQFAEALACGDFALHWEAHGLHYGLPSKIIDDVRAGRTVVANVSRTIVATARAVFLNVSSVLVTAPSEALAARLAARGRVSDGPIEARLRRVADGGAPDIIINNIGRPADHAGELLKAIRGA